MEGYATIDKDVGHMRVRPIVVDYDEARRTFSWEAARRALDGLPGGGLNIAHEAVTRHAEGPRADRVALRFLSSSGRHDLTYGALERGSNRFARALASLGVGRGDRVFTLLGRVPALYLAALGTWKAGAVFCPLFSAFGPDPVAARLRLGAGRVVVTTRAAWQKKIAPQRAGLPELDHVLLVDGSGDGASDAATRALGELLDAASDAPVMAATRPEDPALLHFTSGTTGLPKGALHVHEAVVAHHATGRIALDLHDDDLYWCTADPGWVTGTSFGIVSPLTNGVTTLVDEAEFDAARWYATLARERVTVWYTAPTALRMLMRAGAELRRGHDLSALRFVASVGEPLNPEVVLWTRAVLGVPAHDNWWQTETGGIMIANLAGLPVRPGSMGRPLPGIEAAIVERTPDGGARVLPDDTPGELALRPGWPSMFRAYLDQPERYRASFAGGWYLTGDLARRDRDGYFWFIGRGDDVIKSSGHLIGPFEVESAMLEHPAVAEAAAIGVPDEIAGQRVKVFVSLKAGLQPSAPLERELMAVARRHLGTAVAPKEIAVVDRLPRTRSGKLMRRLLRARELGLPEGDLSTIEGAP